MAYISFQPSDYFNTVLYTGNGSTQSITGVGFQPDWVWIKRRDASASHELHDAVRGATKRLKSDATNAEFTDTDTLTSFDSDGFSIGSGSLINTNSATQVAWNWKANGSGSANTDGSISSTVSANTTAGFSIIKYVGNATSGATIGHGLGATPKFWMLKSLDQTDDWIGYHSSLGATKYIKLNTTDAEGTATDAWNDTAPTSSVISLGNAGTTNGSSENFICYAFAEKKGFSKFGSYTGNGNADGTFVYTGFKPAFLIAKKTNASGSGWVMYDNKRDPDNVVEGVFNADTNAAENTASDWLDFTSNGFKARISGGDLNGSGDSYIYMAFAEHPLVSSNDIPATAR